MSYRRNMHLTTETFQRMYETRVRLHITLHMRRKYVDDP